MDACCRTGWPHGGRSSSSLHSGRPGPSLCPRLVRESGLSSPDWRPALSRAAHALRLADGERVAVAPQRQRGAVGPAVAFAIIVGVDAEPVLIQPLHRGDLADAFIEDEAVPLHGEA